jgi:hypothetical protein
MNSSPSNQTPPLSLRVSLTDGSSESFLQSDETMAREIWQHLDPARLHTQQRIVIAGTHSKSVFVCAEIVRIDFNWPPPEPWQFFDGYADMVELSESEYRKHAHLDESALQPEREEPTAVGNLLVSFLKLHLRNSPPVYLMIEFLVKLPAENHSFMRFLLSKTWFHLRLRDGGVAIVNLANLAGYSVYPGVQQIPTDAWYAEPA